MSDTSRSGPRWGRWRSILVGVLALAATVGSLLFFHRGLADFKGEPIGGWLCWRILALWGYTLTLSVACVSAGLRALAVFRPVEELPTLEALVTSAALGLVVFVFGMYLGGFARVFNAGFAVALPVAMTAAGAADALAFFRARHAAWRDDASPRDLAPRALGTLACVLGLLSIVVVYLGALTPEAINFDASWTHLPIAVDYARAHRIVPFPADYDRCVPHLASLVHTWAMLVPSLGLLDEAPLRWMLAQHLEVSLFLWTLAGVGAMAAWLLDVPRVRGAWAVFFLCPAIFVYDKNLGGAADHDLAFFAAPLFLAAMRAAPRFDPKPCALAGVFAGAALLCKYQAVYLIAGVSLVFAVAGVAGVAAAHALGKSAWRRFAIGAGTYAGVAVLVTMPHFLKNAVFYRDPFYPFFQDVFPSVPTTPNASYLIEWILKDNRWRPEGSLPSIVGESLLLVVTWPFRPHYSFTQDVPDGGVIFVLCLPLLVALRSPRRLSLGVAAGAGCVFAWGMVFRVDRHLQTFMPILAATTAAILVRAWELGVAARVGVATLVAAQVAWCSDAPFYGSQALVKAALDLGRATFDGKSAERFARYRSRERAIGAALPPGARVLLHETKPSLGIDHDVILDTPGRQALLSYDGARSLREVHELYRGVGATHLVWAPGRRPASTKAEDVLVTAYVHRFGKALGRFEDEALVELPVARPVDPALDDHPLRVVTLGLPGYADGLYAIEHLTTYETILEAPGHERAHETFARPDRAMPHSDAFRAIFVEDADALCVAEGAPLGPLARARIEALFEVAETYPHAFTIHVRKPREEAGP